MITANDNELSDNDKVITLTELSNIFQIDEECLLERLAKILLNRDEENQ